MDSNQQITFVAPSVEDLSNMLRVYTIDKFIAQGGMGAVYLATQTSLDRKVAIKILPKEFGDDPGFREAFQEEAKLMAKLNHPNLISVYDFGDIEGMLYIIMEFAEGTTLHHLPIEENLEHEYIARVSAEIASGLFAAHQAGILHRDIKPSNILLNNKNNAKISDFGLARPHGQTESGVIYGTPGYTAPEVLKNPKAVDVQADIFSVGVIIYELLAGKLPEKAYMPVSSIAGANPDFDNIIRKAIHPSPKMRYKTAEALAEDLEDLAKDIKNGKNKPEGAAKALLTGAKKPTDAGTLLRTGASKSKTAPKISPNSGATPILKKTVTHSEDDSSDEEDKNSAAAPVQLATGNEDNEAISPSPLPQADIPVPKVLNKTLFINLFIIAVLAIACVAAWKFVESKQLEAERISAQNAKNKALQDKINKAKRNNDKGGSTRVDTTPKHRPRRGNTELLGDGGDNNGKPITAINIPEMEKTSHALALKQLKAQQLNLLNGIVRLKKLPNNTISRNSSFYLFINQPMTWQQADVFASTYGAQIATCKSQADADFLRKNSKENTKFWLGAGVSIDNKIEQVDGVKFPLNIKYPNPLSAVAYNSILDIAATSPLQKHTFFIQWNTLGDIPSSPDSRLLRLLPTLKNISPEFPALTYRRGSNHYYVVNRGMSWKEANDLARLAGGHLAVLSDEFEADDIKKFLSKVLEPNTYCWVGGKRDSNNKWHNITIEKHEEFHWADGQPSKGDGLVAYYDGSELKHKSEKANKLLSGCIIEWSDSEYEAYKERFVMRRVNNLEDLQKKIKSLYDFEKEQFLMRQKTSANRLAWGLRTWRKSTTKQNRDQYSSQISDLTKSLDTADKISKSFRAPGLPFEAQEIIESCISFQAKQEFNHEETLDSLIKSYETKLQSLYFAQPNRQTAIAKKIAAAKKAHDRDRTAIFE